MSRRKTLPHSEEAERAVLGAILLEPRRIAQVRSRLEPGDWYLDRHRALYQACLALADAGFTPDLLTLRAHLEQAGHLEAAGGPAYLAALDLDLPDLARLDDYVEIVKEHSLRRDLVAGAGRTIRDAVSTPLPVKELLAGLRASTDPLLAQATRVGWEGAGDVVDRLLTTIEEKGIGALCGLTTEIGRAHV